MDTQATQNKSLHPATPSQIKFDFDEEGQYSSDGTKQQQEVLNYLMLGAAQKSQQRNATKSTNQGNEKPAKVDQNNDNQNHSRASPKFALKPIALKPTPTNGGKGSFKTQHLDMIAQIVLLLRQLCRYVGKNKWLQLLIIALTSFYALMCYRLVRYFHALMKREQVMGTLAYRPQDLSHAICHYIMLVLD